MINKQKYYPQGLAKKVHQSTQDLYKECKTQKKKVKKKIKPILFYAWIETLEFFGEILVIKVDQHDIPHR